MDDSRRQRGYYKYILADSRGEGAGGGLFQQVAAAVSSVHNYCPYNSCVQRAQTASHVHIMASSKNDAVRDYMRVFHAQYFLVKLYIRHVFSCIVFITYIYRSAVNKSCSKRVSL